MGVEEDIISLNKEITKLKDEQDRLRLSIAKDYEELDKRIGVIEDEASTEGEEIIEDEAEEAGVDETKYEELRDEWEDHKMRVDEEIHDIQKLILELQRKVKVLERKSERPLPDKPAKKSKTLSK